MNAINTRCDNIKEQILESVDEKIDKQIGEITLSIETVSYTHLDVYKRQIVQ